ncbi:MAG: hypothetical protein ACOC2R_10010 [Spirochaetota bacterium]
MQKSTDASRNYFAFLWHAIFLSITITFTEVNSVIPAMILEVGGGEFHIGIVAAIMIGTLIGLLGYSPVFIAVGGLALASRFALHRLVCPVDRPAQHMIDSELGNR